MRTRIFVTTRFEGFHRWPDAPDEVAFLRDRHRHVFHVRLEVSVTHDDRDVEFILQKRALDKSIELAKEVENTSTWSCEQWARHLLDLYPEAAKAEVSEDGENGAVAER